MNRIADLGGTVVSWILAAALLGGAESAWGQNNALRLGPTNTNTYVTFGSTSALGLSNFTIETWFNRQGTGATTSSGTGGIAAFVPLVTKGAGEAEGSNVDANYLLGINTAGNVIAADFEEAAGGAGPAGQNHPISGVTPIQNNTWYHAAATYDGSTWRLYLNGELEAERFIGQPTRSDSIQHAALGTTIRSNGTTVAGFFDGTLDEARIWNVARSATDIRATMNVQNPSDPSLIARWGLNEGAGTAVSDSAGTAQNGTITGTNFSWVAGAPFDIAPCANNASSMMRFAAADAATPIFDDYVTFGNAAELGLTTFTIETWFKREGVGVGNTTGTAGIGGTGGPAGSLVPLVTKGAPQADGSNVDANYILGINTTGDVLAADFEDTATGLNHPVVGTTAITNNNWHHAAATYDGTTWRLYLDGNLDATAVVGGFTPRSDSIQHAGLGAMLTSTGTRLGAFHGVMDEVRIWNFARSQTDIQNDMLQQVTSGTGLVARWGLSEGSGTTIADSVGPSFTTGTLMNGPTWTASNSLLDATGACSDSLFCNGADTCNGNGLRCAVHDGDSCVGGAECNDLCDEALDTCAVPAGTGCTDDGNACTDDECDGAGTCDHTNDDTNTCGSPSDTDCDNPDTCAAGTCLSNNETAGTACTDDGNACTDDECDGAGTCDHTNDDTNTCEDEFFCNGAESCQGGLCQAGAPPCAGSCDEAGDVCSGICPPVPQTCRTAEKSLLLIKDSGDDTRDKLLWKWTKGLSTSQTEFGDPTDSAEYFFCLYAGSLSTLIAEAQVPPGANWSALSNTGYAYKDPAASMLGSGIQKILVKGSDANTSKIGLKGKGQHLPDLLQTIPLTGPVTAQLLNTESGLCWGGQYDAAAIIKNADGKFKGKTSN